jgi:Zn-dependent peptidase ImmA (M78 family)/DNA-binding XRE family transcriptional regulator
VKEKIKENKIGALIELARETRGLNQFSFSKEISVSQAKLSKLENGEVGTSEAMKLKIAKALDYPVSFFNKDSVPGDIHVDFRKSVSLNLTAIKQVKAIISRTRLEVMDLFKNFDTITIEIPEEVDENTPEGLARKVRGIFGIKHGPVLELINKAERSGIVFLPMNLDRNLNIANRDKGDTFSACVVSVGERKPLIIYNKNHTFDRIRFSIAHELGHVYLHHYNTLKWKYDRAILEEEKENVKEIEANRFAAEFLMPENEISKELNELHAMKLMSLKKKWKVSFAALIERAKHLKTITELEYSNLRKYLSYKKWLTNEPIEIEKEEPTTISQMIKVYLFNYGTTAKALAKRIGLSFKEFTEIYPIKLEVPA